MNPGGGSSQSSPNRSVDTAPSAAGLPDVRSDLSIAHGQQHGFAADANGIEVSTSDACRKCGPRPPKAHQSLAIRVVVMRRLALASGGWADRKGASHACGENWCNLEIRVGGCQPRIFVPRR